MVPMHAQKAKEGSPRTAPPHPIPLPKCRQCCSICLAVVELVALRRVAPRAAAQWLLPSRPSHASVPPLARRGCRSATTATRRLPSIVAARPPPPLTTGAGLARLVKSFLGGERERV